MENRRQVFTSSSSSSPPSSSPPTNFNSLDQLFGPRDDSSFSASSTSSYGGSFGSIFPPPSKVQQGRKISHANYQTSFTGSHGNHEFQVGKAKHGQHQVPSSNPSVKPGGNGGATSKVSGANSVMYQDETAEPCYLSSSIYYGGQENYSPRTTTKASDSQHHFEKDGDGLNESNSDSASRGNWWQGSLYY